MQRHNKQTKHCTNLHCIQSLRVRMVAKGYKQKRGLDCIAHVPLTPQIDGIPFVWILAYTTNSTKWVISRWRIPQRKEESLSATTRRIFITWIKLLKGIYGVMHAGRWWTDVKWIITQSYYPELRKSQTEPCIYYKTTKDGIFIISVHVDDSIVGHNNDRCMKGFLQPTGSSYAVQSPYKIVQFAQCPIYWVDTSGLSQIGTYAFARLGFGFRDRSEM